jgi:uncharacterized protein YndB with AHSA1/START domain
MPTVAVSRVIRAPQQEIWSAVSDIENARRWNEAWKDVEITSTQRHGIGMTFAATNADGDTYAFEVCEWSAPDRIAFCPIRDPLEPRYAINLDSHTFELHPVSDDETEVTLMASATSSGIRGYFIGTFFWPGHQREGLNTALSALQAVFEPDAVTTPEEPDPVQE